MLKGQNNKVYIEHQRVERPWGDYTVLHEAQGYKIKNIVVLPEQSLSMQAHNNRSEHWVVVRGTAQITIGNKVMRLEENQSAYIPKAVLHRLENPGKVVLEVIEVQCGNYLEEDDIVRYDDMYKRGLRL